MSESELLVIVPIHSSFMTAKSVGVDDEVKSSETNRLEERDCHTNDVGSTRTCTAGGELPSNIYIEMSTTVTTTNEAENEVVEKEEKSFGGGCCGSSKTGQVDVVPYQILTCPERCVSNAARRVKRMSRLWFAHFFLISILLSYTALGAVIFNQIEAPHESKEKHDVLDLRKRLLIDLWNVSQSAANESEWLNESFKKLCGFEKHLEKWYAMGFSTDPNKKLWSFWGAMFYCGTVYSTIGYGHIVPSTTEGRALTMVYATFGIPLLLMVLADFGKLFTRGIKLLWSLAYRFYHTKSCKELRSTEVIQAMVKAISRKNTDDRTYTANTTNNCNYDLANCREDILSSPRDSKYEIDDEFDLPVGVAVSLLIGYVMLGALMFIQWETDWTYFEAVYFVFISMSTIGFGDYVPQHPIFMMGTFVYLLFGLALTSMCINVIQEWLTRTFKKASTKLGARMGIEANEIPTGAVSSQLQDVSSSLADFHASFLKRKGE